MPLADSTRCSSASVPTVIRWEAVVAADSAVNSPTGSPISASNSSRARFTPSRRRFSLVPLHTAQILGRDSPLGTWNQISIHLAHKVLTVHRVLMSSPQDAHANITARPFRFKMHSIGPSRRRRRTRLGEKSPVRPGSSRRLSATWIRGQPARSVRSDPPQVTRSAAANASRLGLGESNTQGTPAARARMIDTSRACQLGLRSLLRLSSCSSTTTTAPRSFAGPSAAVRAPSTTPWEWNAPAQSRGRTNEGTPDRRTRAAKCCAVRTSGVMTSTVPRFTPARNERENVGVGWDPDRHCPRLGHGRPCEMHIAKNRWGWGQRLGDTAGSAARFVQDLPI